MFSFLDSIPGVGHTKGLLHYMTGDVEAGNRAMSQSTRSTVVIGAGAAGFVAGPVGSAALGASAGALWDCVESVVVNEPTGLLANVDDIVQTTSRGEFPIGGLARTTLTIGGDLLGGAGGGSWASSMSKTAGKTAVEAAGKSAVKEAGKSAAKEAGKSAAKEAGKSAAKEATKSAVKEAGKSAAKEATKSAVKEAGKSAAKEATMAAAKEASMAAAKEAGKTAVKEAGKSAAKEAGKSSFIKVTGKVMQAASVIDQTHTIVRKTIERTSDQIQSNSGSGSGSNSTSGSNSSNSGSNNRTDNSSNSGSNNTTNNSSNSGSKNQSTNDSKNKDNKNKSANDSKDKDKKDKKPEKGDGKKPDKNKKSETTTSTNPNQQETPWTSLLLNIFRDKNNKQFAKVEDITVQGQRFFDNIDKHQKKYYKWLLGKLYKDGFLDKVLAFVKEMMNTLRVEDVTILNFVSLCEFMQQYLSEQMARHNAVLKEQQDTPDDMETRRAQVMEIVNTQIDSNDFTRIFQEIRVQLENSNLRIDFRNIIAAIYHYFKHRIVGKYELSVEEYVNLANTNIDIIKETQEYQDLINNGTTIDFERYYDCYGTRLWITIKRQGNRVVLSTVLFKNESDPGDKDGDMYINGRKL